MSDIIKPSVLIVEGILKDVVMKKAIVTSSSSTPAKEPANLLKEPPPPPRKSKSNIFENTGELCAENNRSSSKHRDHSEYLKLEKDYSHRPRVPGMDWAECPWAHPDDSLFTSSDDVNVKKP